MAETENALKYKPKITTMARKQTITGAIVVKYLEKFPNTPSLTLARMIYEENNLAFTSVEHVRSVVRIYRGSNGKYTRGFLSDKRFYGTGVLSEGEEPIYEPYQLPLVNNKILFMSDIHLPFHDLPSIKMALADGKERGCNTVILGGDIVDMYSISRFDKVPNKSTFVKERELFWALIDDVNTYMPNAKVIWICGNHEDRFERYMLSKCAEIYGVDDFSMERVFALRELGVEWVEDKRYIKADGLNILHGHEFGNSITSPVNPARGMYLKAKDSAVFGHLHRTSEHTEADLRGNVKTVYSVGCLCYLHPAYRPLNTWNSGYATIDINKYGYMVKNKKIINGKIQ